MATLSMHVSGQVASVLLPLCFLYDVFWVFLQPLLIGGPSVMVQARPRRTLTLHLFNKQAWR